MGVKRFLDTHPEADPLAARSVVVRSNFYAMDWEIGLIVSQDALLPPGDSQRKRRGSELRSTQPEKRTWIYRIYRMIVDPGYRFEKSLKKHRLCIRFLQSANLSTNGNHPVHRVHQCSFISFENICIGAYRSMESKNPKAQRAGFPRILLSVNAGAVQGQFRIMPEVLLLGIRRATAKEPFRELLTLCPTLTERNPENLMVL